MITISLFYFYNKGFILMNIWIIAKNATKIRYLKKKFYRHLMEDINDADYAHAKKSLQRF